MATIETFKVNKGLKYLVKARKDGYYDHAQVFDGTEEDTSVSVPAMTPYDGLSMTQVKGVKSPDIVDFTNTILPWKWDYEKYLSTSKFALMPLNKEYNIFISTINGTMAGTLTNKDYIISGFSESNYLLLPNPDFKNHTWEIQIKFTTGTVASTDVNKLFGSAPGNTSDRRHGINVTYSDGFIFSVSTDGATWAHSNEGTYILQPNTTYWIKFGWTGAEYYFEYSLDGKDYIRDITFLDTTPLYNGLTFTTLGGGYTSKWVAFNGSIDLNETYIKINNKVTWQHLKREYNDNISFVGNVAFDSETMVVSNFSASNYITTPVFNPANNPWEVRMKFTTGSDFTATKVPVIFSSAYNNSDKGINLNFHHSSSHEEFNLYVSHNGSNWLFDVWGTHKVQLNTTYWVRFGWTGAEYYLDYSTNGKDYIRDITYESSIAAHTLGSNSVTCIGTSSQKTNPFNGSIDLSETELLINGETFYKPEVTYVTNTVQGCTHNYTDTGQATTLNCFTVNGDERVILTPDTSYNNERFLGTVEIAEHTVYDYVDGEWRQK